MSTLGYETDALGSVEHLGTLDAERSLRLLQHKTLSHPSIADSAVAQLQEMRARLGKPSLPEDAIETLTRESTVHAALDPERTFPYRTRRETIATVNGVQTRKIEEWMFDWPRARGCF